MYRMRGRESTPFVARLATPVEGALRKRRLLWKEPVGTLASHAVNWSSRGLFMQSQATNAAGSYCGGPRDFVYPDKVNVFHQVSMHLKKPTCRIGTSCCKCALNACDLKRLNFAI